MDNVNPTPESVRPIGTFTATRNALALFVLAATGTLGGTAQAAGECKIESGYHYGNPRVDTSMWRTFDAGQTITINRDSMNYTTNVGRNTVKLIQFNHLTGSSYSVTLSKGGRDPLVAFHLVPITLKTATCLVETSNGQLFDTLDAAVASMKAMGKSATEVAAFLMGEMQIGTEQTVQLLLLAGYTSVQAAKVLRDYAHLSAINTVRLILKYYKVGGEAAAEALKAAGYTADQVAAALKEAYGYTASQVASVLKNVYGATAPMVAVALKSAGYALDQTAAALKSAFNVTAEALVSTLASVYQATVEQLAGALKSAGFAIRQVIVALTEQCGALGCPQDRLNEIVRAVAEKYNPSIQQLADALKYAGIGIDLASAALKSAFNVTAEVLASTLKVVYGATIDQVVAELKALGYTLNQVAVALKSTYATTATKVTQVAKAVYGASATVAATALRQAGYSVEQAHKSLMEVYRVGSAEAIKILAAAGFDTRPLGSASSILLR